jgi:hypothetical protein
MTRAPTPQYVFIRNDGSEQELTKLECYRQICEHTGLDEVMVAIMLSREGVQHPAGRWVMQRGPGS